MIGFRTRFFFLLVVYFAGFATAVYILSPTPEAGTEPGQAKNFKSALKSEQFTQAINSGMHKCVGLGKDIAERASDLIKEKLAEMQAEQAARDHS